MSSHAAVNELPKGKKIGKITHYFNKIGVAVVEAENDFKVGDTLVISGHDREFQQSVDSMQVEHQQVTEAQAGDAVGLKVEKEVKDGDVVYIKGE